MEWQPIETVPPIYLPDSVLLSNGEMVWEDWLVENDTAGDEYWFCDGQWDDHKTATHWMPLPKPPSEGKRK